MTEENTSKESNGSEELHVTGEKLVAKVKEIVAAGNARRIIIKKPSGETVMEIPLTVGAAVSLLIPVFVALGAIAVLAAEWVIIVERRD